MIVSDLAHLTILSMFLWLQQCCFPILLVHLKPLRFPSRAASFRAFKVKKREKERQQRCRISGYQMGADKNRIKNSN